jgi:hypothetical protein
VERGRPLGDLRRCSVGERHPAVGDDPKRLRSDSQLAEDLDYCGPRGIPHSHFLGGPPVWTEADRDKARAWQAKQASTCGGCGFRRDEWDHDKRAQQQSHFFEPDICPWCEQKERVEAGIRSDKELSQRRGLRLVAKRRSAEGDHQSERQHD